MFWPCPKLIPYWTGIFNTFSYIMCNVIIDPNPLTAVFGLVPQRTPITNYQAVAIAFSTLLARCLIICCWKKVGPLSHKCWMEEVMSHLKLQQRRYTTQGSTQKYYKIWQPFLNYFETEFPASNTT